MDVGHLRQGTRPHHVQKPNISEAFPEAAIREGADELTMRADEVETLRALHQHKTTLSSKDGDRRWLMRTGMPSAKQSTKELNGEEWEELYCHSREMSQATGAKKPSESQKTKAIWAMKAAKDTVEEYYDRARKEDIPGKNKRHVWSCGKNTSKTRIASTGKAALNCLEKSLY